jgi:hypothetical protein
LYLDWRVSVIIEVCNDKKFVRENMALVLKIEEITLWFSEMFSNKVKEHLALIQQKKKVLCR